MNKKYNFLPRAIRHAFLCTLIMKTNTILSLHLQSQGDFKICMVISWWWSLPFSPCQLCLTAEATQWRSHNLPIDCNNLECIVCTQYSQHLHSMWENGRDSVCLVHRNCKAQSEIMWKNIQKFRPSDGVWRGNYTRISSRSHYLVESLIIVHVQSITTKTCFVSSSSAKFCDNFLNIYELCR